MRAEVTKTRSGVVILLVRITVVIEMEMGLGVRRVTLLAPVPQKVGWIRLADGFYTVNRRRLPNDYASYVLCQQRLRLGDEARVIFVAATPPARQIVYLR